MSRGGNQVSTPLTSVILPVRNGASRLAEQLSALASQSYRGEWELLVVDNGSVDETRNITMDFRHRFASLRLLDAGERPGAAYARNVGARAAAGEFLLYVDADDRVDEDWLASMVAASRESDAVGGALHLFFHDRAGNSVYDGPPLQALPRIPGSSLSYAAGANCGIRLSVLEAVGGWDEHFFAEEEVDLFWRVQLAGYELRFVADALVDYRLRSSSRAVWRQHLRYARCFALLHRKFGNVLMPRPSLKSVFSELMRTSLAVLKNARSPRSRRGLLIKLANLIGSVLGSIEHRHLYVSL